MRDRALMSTPFSPESYRSEPALAAEPSAVARELQWLSAGCLLEPLIGVLWQWAFARCVGHPLRLHHAVILGASLWLVYLGDHWLDGLRSQRPLTARHRWVIAQRRPLLGLWLLVLLCTLSLAALTLTPREWSFGAALLACTAGYFWRIHARVPRLRHKELLVALVYTGGISLFSWQAVDVSALLCCLPFGGLVLLNLAVIAHRERDVDRHHGLDFVVRRSADLPALLQSAAWTLLVGSAAAGLLWPSWANWFFCIAASTAALS